MYIIKINKKFTLTEYVLTKVLTFPINLHKQSKQIFYNKLIHRLLYQFAKIKKI